MARAERIVAVLAVGIGLLVLYQVFAAALFPPRGNEGEPISVPNPATVYDPVTSEALPDGFRQLLPRDGIAPVYEPRFVPAESAWSQPLGRAIPTPSRSTSRRRRQRHGRRDARRGRRPALR
ncbi:MAG: hypothetical protein ACRDKB_00640 [Actinomycetota bacterium]